MTLLENPFGSKMIQDSTDGNNFVQVALSTKPFDRFLTSRAGRLYVGWKGYCFKLSSCMQADIFSYPDSQISLFLYLTPSRQICTCIQLKTIDLTVLRPFHYQVRYCSIKIERQCTWQLGWSILDCKRLAYHPKRLDAGPCQSFFLVIETAYNPLGRFYTHASLIYKQALDGQA